MQGLAFGKRLISYQGKSKMLDPVNRLYARVKFNPKNGGFMGLFQKHHFAHDDFVY
jgi:hypothetical protein